MKTGSTAHKLTLITLILLITTTGCTLHRNAVPLELADEAVIPDMPGIRAWGEQYSEVFQADIIESMQQEKLANPDRDHSEPRHYDVLAVSGGGASGAFGSGFLCGWTKSGNRPQFKLVTGISTGALIAPAAFLGPKYDECIRETYTQTKTKDILTVRIGKILGFLWAEAFADTTPLQKQIEKQFDREIFDAVAAEHRKGRRLYVGTTNLDADRLVIWNMGKIADSGHPDSLQLFRDVLLASASIPVAFPPVYFDVEADGQLYDEMHVDGGTIAQVFFYGFTLDPDSIALEVGTSPTPRADIDLYVLYNGQLGPAPRQMPRKVTAIIERSLTTLMRARATGDMYRIYLVTKQNDIGFNYIDIPADYKPEPKEMFDPIEMQRLFDLGFQMAESGHKWRNTPPNFDNTQ